MKRLLAASILLICTVFTAVAGPPAKGSQSDSLRIAELDAFWAEMAHTVQQGDFEGYSALYHPDAVVVFGFGNKPASMPVAWALKSWKEGFDNTAAGKQRDNVAFRFTQRVGDPGGQSEATTAHETGMFVFTSTNASGETTTYIAHFETLLVKRDGRWLVVMEYQKAQGTQQEWEALQPE